MNSAIQARIDEALSRGADPACLRIGLAGGSGSGKSTIAEALRQGLSPCTVKVVRLDQFFKPAAELPTYHSSYHGEDRPDYNRPESLRVEEMVASCRTMDGSDVVIFDGHFSLYYPEMRALMDIKCFVTVEAEEMLERRTKRNLAVGYGGDLDTILHYNRECVLPRYEEFILPTRRYADIEIPNGDAQDAERDRLLGILCRRIHAWRAHGSARA